MLDQVSAARPARARTSRLVATVVLAGGLLAAGSAGAAPPLAIAPSAPAPVATAPVETGNAAGKAGNAEKTGKDDRKKDDFRLQKVDVFDYGLLASSAVAVAVVNFATTPNPVAVIGPRYDPAQPTFSAEDASKIGRSYRDGDTVPTGALFGAAGLIGVGLAGVGLYDACQSDWREKRELHDLMVGYLDALALTQVTTDVGKVAFGRLRPDFLGRLEQYDECVAGNGECAEQKEALDDGRKSFPSGHASISFAMANYAALAIGGRFVWGDRRTAVSAPIGVAAQVGLLGLATWVGVSRVEDHRHNPTDVMGGMALGLLWSNVAYWRRFDSHGRPRRAVPIDVTPGPGELGAGLQLRF